MRKFFCIFAGVLLLGLAVSCVLMLPVPWLVIGDLHVPEQAAAPAPDEPVTAEPISLDVTVQRENGAAVAGADVYVFYSRGLLGPGDRMLAQQRTDASGRAAFPGVFRWEALYPEVVRELRPSGVPLSNPSLVVIAYSRTIGGGTAKVAPSGDSKVEVAVELKPNVPKESRVLDAEGGPLGGARVFPRSLGNAMFRTNIGICTGVTDDEGVVTIMAPGNATFWAEKDGYVRSSVVNDTKLFLSSEVSGRVVYADEAPAAGALVWLQQSDAGMGWADAAYADDEGYFIFRNAPANRPGNGAAASTIRSRDTVVLYAQHVRESVHLQTGRRGFNLKPGEAREAELTLKRPPRISGRVLSLDTHEPIEGLTLSISFETPGRSGSGTSTTTDAEGRFEVEVLPDTTIYVMATGDDYDDYVVDRDWFEANPCLFRERITEDVSDLEWCVKVLPSIKVSGQLLTSQGTPWAGARVFARGNETGVPSDADGRFVMRVPTKDACWGAVAVGPDSHTRRPSSEEETRAGEAAWAVFSESERDVTLNAHPCVRLEGVFLDAAQNPAPDLDFSICPFVQDLPLERLGTLLTTDVSGAFTLHGLCPDAQYRVRLHSDRELGYESNTFVFDMKKYAPDQQLRFFVLRHNRTISGRVVDDKGDPVVDAKATVMSWRTKTSGNEFAAYRTDEDGRFTIRRLSSGTSVLRIEAKGYNTRILEANPDSDAVDVVLRPKEMPGSNVITVVDECERRLPGVTVLAYASRDGVNSTKLQLVTDDDGRTAFSWDPQAAGMGHILVGCVLDGYRHAYTSAVPDEDITGRLTVRSEGPVWDVTVVDAERRPISGATVSIVEFQQDGCRETPLKLQFGSDYSFKTDEKGRAVLSCFSRHDSLGASVSAPGYASGWANLDARDRVGVYTPPQGTLLAVSTQRLLEDPAGRAVITLRKGCTIRGRVVLDGTDQPVPDMAMVADSLFTNDTLVTTDEEGRFSLEHLHAGKYTIADRTKDVHGKLLPFILKSPIELDLQPDESTEITLHAAPRVVLRGKLANAADGQPPEHRVAVVFDEGSELPHGVLCGEDGSWEVHTYPGTFELIVMDRAGKTFYKRIPGFEVAEGPQEDIVLDVDFSTTSQ